MLKLLLDHNFDQDYLRQLIQRIPDLDFLTALEAGLDTIDDRQLLRWAASKGRVLLTHDRNTIPGHYAALVNTGEKTSGILLIPHWVKFGQVLDELELQIVCGEHEDWIDTLRIL